MLNPRLRLLSSITGALGIACLLVFAGCDTRDVAGPDHGVEQIVITPSNVSLGVGEQQEFDAFLLTAEGDTVDAANLNVQWEWWSTNTDVFTVEPGGLATGHNPGQEFCVVEATILVGSSNFNGRDSAFVVVF